jgi:Periplasmic lysozyme inhibitor of I-type lysozyme
MLFSVRVYRDLGVGDYIAGTIHRRDGLVRRRYRSNPDGAGREVIAVEVETAGSGRYSHAEMFVSTRRREPFARRTRSDVEGLDIRCRRAPAPGVETARWH